MANKALSPDGSSLAAGTGGSLVTSAGTWTFGTATAGGGNVILLNGSPAAEGAAGELVISGGNVYADTVQGSWWEWTGSGWTESTAPASVTSATASPDGSSLAAGTGGSLVTSAGTWTFGTATAGGGNVILLNGSPAAEGAAGELVISGGNVYADTVQGSWWEWTGSGWTESTAPASVTSATASPDGSSLAAGTGGSLVTSAGTWTFGTATAGGGNVILLNGSPAAEGAAGELVISGGNVYADTVQGSWWEWTGSGWTESTAPASVTSATASPDGSSLAAGTGGSLVTSAGTWTFGTATAGGGNVILLNGSPAAEGAAGELVISGGNVYADTVQGSWWEWTGSGWTESTAPASVTSATASPDGSSLVAGTGGSLVTSAGTWTFGTAMAGGGNVILLNGSPAAEGAAGELVISGGNVYADTVQGSWWEWTGSGWTESADPSSTTMTSGVTTQSAATSAGSPMVQFQLPADVGFALQNTQATALSPHEVTLGEVFADGQVPGGDQLTAVIGGVSYAAQLDVKTSYADGSVETGIVTLDAPAIPGNTTLNATLTAAAGTPGPSVDISQLPGSGYDVVVDLTMQNGDGTQTGDQLNVGTLLAQALAAGTASYWMQGPQATEVQFDVPISGSFHVTFDVTDYADGTTATDVQFNNDDAMQAAGGTVTYNETITQNGNTVSQQNNITQYQYQDWNQEIWSNGAPQANVQLNILALEKAGAIPAYDLSWSLSNIDPNLGLTLSSEAVAIAGSGWNTITNGALPIDGITQYMPMTGGRADIGAATDGTALWLITQNQVAAEYALGQADVAGSVPWNYYDPTTGNEVSVEQYPQLWTDGRGGPGSYTTGLTQQVSNGTGWTPDPAHQPDLSYEAYLLTGNLVYLNDLNAQADFGVVDDWPGYRDQGGYTDIVANGQDQVRSQAWSLREIDEAAYANPDGSAEKTYFTQIMNDNWSWLVSQLPNWTAQEGQAYGYIPGTYVVGTMAPWQQDYFASTTVAAAEMGNQDAVQVLEWESNFLVGRFLNQANGFNPNDGAAYNLTVGNGTSYYQTWAQIEAATQAAGQSNGTGYASGDYGELALESLAGVITVDSLYPTAAPETALTAAMQAYGWLLASAAAPGLRIDAQFQIAPRLPDGNYLDQSNIQIDTTANNLTLTTTSGADSLIHVGGGNDTLVGGSGTTDLLFGGTGNDVFRAGTGNEYMFGGTAANTFVDGTGNDYMQGAGVANTYVFDEAHSGQDTIANFNLTADTLQIGPNLNGNGMTTAAALIAAATVSNGNTTFHLSPQDSISLLGVATPSSLVHSILVS